MKFEHDATGVKPTQYSIVPKGTYHVAITAYTEKFTANNDPMIRIECEVDDKIFLGSKVWHNVTFLPRDKKGAGIALHFLKTIGEPYEGKLVIDPQSWVGKRFVADVVVGEYNGRPQNSIVAVYPVQDGVLRDPAIKDTNTLAEDEVPF